jgi:hypothetical protein
MQIIQGLVGMFIGFLILVFRPYIKDWTGDIAFAERYFGLGGTWIFFILLGGGLFIFSLMWMTGTLQDFVVKFFVA